MDYAKSGDWELGMVIEHHEWVEGTEIRDWKLELGQDLTPCEHIYSGYWDDQAGT